MAIRADGKWRCDTCAATFVDYVDVRDCEASHKGAGLMPADFEAPLTKATNPKDAIASNKAPLHLVPASFKAYTALALAEGVMKYGAWNWRAAGVRASVYVSALQRHLDKWFNGEEFDPLTGVPHLANAAACLAVLIDSKTQGNMTDDRPIIQPGLPELVDQTVPESVAKLRDQFGDYTPTHHTRDAE